MAACGNHIFQCMFQIGCRIEGAVKGDFEGVGQLNKLTCAFNVDGAVGEQYTKNDAGSADAAKVLNFVAHGRKCRRIVGKAIGVGAHHYVNGNPASTHGLLDERMRRRKTVLVKRGAKLNAVRTALLRSEARFHGFRAQFEFHPIPPGHFSGSIDAGAAQFPAIQSSLTLANETKKPATACAPRENQSL